MFSAAIASDEKALHARPQRVRTLLLHCLLKKKFMKTTTSVLSNKMKRNSEMHITEEERDIVRKIASSLFAVGGGGGGGIGCHSRTKTRGKATQQQLPLISIIYLQFTIHVLGFFLSLFLRSRG